MRCCARPDGVPLALARSDAIRGSSGRRPRSVGSSMVRRMRGRRLRIRYGNLRGPAGACARSRQAKQSAACPHPAADREGHLHHGKPLSRGTRTGRRFRVPVCGSAREDPRRNGLHDGSDSRHLNLPSHWREIPLSRRNARLSRARQSAPTFLDKIRSLLYVFILTDQRAGPQPGGESPRLFEKPSRPQPGARVRGEEEFFIWIRCNPLKSPDSAKGIQGNPSNGGNHYAHTKHEATSRRSIARVRGTPTGSLVYQPAS